MFLRFFVVQKYPFYSFPFLFFSYPLSTNLSAPRYPLSAVFCPFPSLRSLRNLRLKILVNPVILSKKFVFISVHSWFSFFSLWPKFFRVNQRDFLRNLRLNSLSFFFCVLTSSGFFFVSLRVEKIFS